MPGLSLRDAAREGRVSKSTILRAIQGGRLSAARTDDGGYSIDPSELFRVYPPQRSAEQAPGQDATPDLSTRNAILEAEIAALKAILDAEKRRADEIREDRDRWHAQAERLTLSPPATAGWWPFRRNA